MPDVKIYAEAVFMLLYVIYVIKKKTSKTYPSHGVHHIKESESKEKVKADCKNERHFTFKVCDLIIVCFQFKLVSAKALPRRLKIMGDLSVRTGEHAAAV